MVATVVTCGGLCPGLNAVGRLSAGWEPVAKVIRELVMMLAQYGVRLLEIPSELRHQVQKIYGIRGGYKGAQPPRVVQLQAF